MPINLQTLAGLFGAGATNFLQNDAIHAAEDAGREAQVLAQQVSGDIMADSAFTPYSVTSGTGTVDSLAQDGNFAGLNMTLSPEQQQNVTDMLAAARGQAVQTEGDMFGQTVDQMGMLAGLGIGNAAQSEQDIFNLLNAVQTSQQERDRLALEQRLFNQGRTDVRTAQFGGTSEQLALAKAQQEQQAGTAVNAFELARQNERDMFGQFGGLFANNLQNKDISGSLADMYYKNSFMPTDDLRRTATLGADIGSIAQQAKTEGIRQSGGILESGMEAKIKAQDLANQARIARNKDLVNLLIGTTNEEGSIEGGFLDAVRGLFS